VGLNPTQTHPQRQWNKARDTDPGQREFEIPLPRLNLDVNTSYARIRMTLAFRDTDKENKLCSREGEGNGGESMHVIPSHMASMT
jgi:hypothetical protein